MAGPILVTGATGTVGGELVGQLTAAGYEVRAAVHTPTRARRLGGRGITAVALDYDDPGTWGAALSGVEGVFFVGWAGPGFADLSARFAAAAQRAGAQRLVKLSAYGADFAPEFLIARHHCESERAIEATGIAYTHLRPNVFMQNLINYYGESIRRDGSSPSRRATPGSASSTSATWPRSPSRPSPSGGTRGGPTPSPGPRGSPTTTRPS